MYIGLQGFIGSGKDTVGRYIASRNDFEKDSFATTLKDICAVMFGWPREMLEGHTEESREWREQPDLWWSNHLGIENFTPRYALQYLGTDILRNQFHSDLWLLTFKHRMNNSAKGKNIILTDCRFKNEIAFFRNMGGKIIFIDSGERPEWYEIALLANTGTQEEREMYSDVMTNDYSYVHRSEWDWVGTDPDVIILNDFEEKTPETKELLYCRVDDALEDMYRISNVVYEKKTWTEEQYP
jgi:hypothetical protein